MQANGGNDPSRYVDKIVRNGSVVAQDGERNGYNLTGEFGDAGRKFPNAVNIATGVSRGVLGDFHNSHNHLGDWASKVPDRSWFDNP